MENKGTIDTSQLGKREGAMRWAKRGALATLAVAAFALFAGGIADTFRPISAETVQINGNLLGSGFVQITDGACSAANTANQPDYDNTNNTLNINVMPNAIANNCLGVKVTTDNTPGYTLTMSGPTDGSLTLAGQTIQPKAGSLTAPTVFASNPNGAEWGFAIPDGQIQGYDWGFDTSYTVLARDNTDNTAKYAPVPKETVAIDTVGAISGTQEFDYDVFFAVAASNNAATGTYTGSVVFSAVGNAAAMADCANMATGFTSGCTDQNITMKLPSGMVPVVLNDHDNDTTTAPQVVIKAAADADWYDYAQKEWANAVTFATAANRSLASGTVLTQAQINDILGYWVYVPRYEYRLVNTGFDGVSHCSADNPQFCPQAFEVRFVDNTAATKVGTNIGDWQSHPGFRTDLNGDGDYLDANEQVSGLWVAKYEMTGANGSPTSVPDSVPMTSINMATIHTNSQAVPAYHGVTLTAGAAMANNATNSSWAAATYLSQSLYGVCTNKHCTSDNTPMTTADSANLQKVWNNGTGECSSPYNMGRTGYGNGGKSDACSNSIGVADGGAAGSGSYTTDNAYYGVNGLLASSTGNLFGIYDMAGGAWEYVSSVRSQADDATPTWASSGLAAVWNTQALINQFTDTTYRNTDFLNCTSCTDWQPIKFGSFAGLNRYYGTALAETVAQNSNTASTIGGWGSDHSLSPIAGHPWFIRGGQSYYGAAAGVFAFGRVYGGAYVHLGWRSVLSGV